MSLKMSPLFYQHVTILPDILITLESKQLRVELKADGKCSFNLKKAWKLFVTHLILVPPQHIPLVSTVDVSNLPTNEAALGKRVQCALPVHSQQFWVLLSV